MGRRSFLERASYGSNPSPKMVGQLSWSYRRESPVQWMSAFETLMGCSSGGRPWYEDPLVDDVSPALEGRWG